MVFGYHVRMYGRRFVRMHVEAKKMATAGLLVAFSVIMVILSSVIETSSLFFIAAGSFGVGIAVREWGLRYGIAFWLASVLLNFIVAPNKMYCITFSAMGLYVWTSELLWKKISDAKNLQHRNVKLWIGKYVCFNAMYIPTILLFPELIYGGEVSLWITIGMLLAGQLALFIYDIAYRSFQSQIWGKLRVRLMTK